MNKRTVLGSAIGAVFVVAGCGAGPVPVGETTEAICWGFPASGENLPLANGINRWQGFPVGAGHPTNPQALVAAAASGLTPGEPSCTFGLPAGQPGPVYGSAALFGSSDGGANWRHNCAPWPANAVNALAGATTWWESDPHVAWDDNGTAYAVYVLHASNGGAAQGSALALAHSTDNGTSWVPDSVPANALLSSNARWATPRMAIDTSSGGAYSHHGRQYIAYVANNLVKVLFFDDATQTWETRSIMAPEASHVQAAPNLKVGADGEVYLMYTELDISALCTGMDKTYLVKSGTGGDTWTKRGLVDAHLYQTYAGCKPAELDPPAQPSERGNAYGWLDVDNNPASPYFGYLYMVTADYNPDLDPELNHHFETDIFFRHSSDGGASWSPRVRVNNDPFLSTQFLPALSVDRSDGTVSVAWFDSRNSPWITTNDIDLPAVPATGVQAFTARSSNGGSSFDGNWMVIDDGHRFYDVADPANLISLWGRHSFLDSSAGDDDQLGLVYNYGDFLGLIATNRTVHPFWIDTRDFGDQLRNRPLYEDVATMTLTYCSPPVFPNPPSVRRSGSSVIVQWSAPSSWGTGACGGTYTVERKKSGSLWAAYASGLTPVGWTDQNVPSGTYYYRVTATNNCSGTSLTPMSTTSPQSAPIAMP